MASLYREAMAALRLYTYPEDTIARLREAARGLEALPGEAGAEADDDLARLRRWYLGDAEAEIGPDTVRASLAADLLDRNREGKIALQGVLERIQWVDDYERGASRELADLYGELIAGAESRLRFPDLEVSDWLGRLGRLLLVAGATAEGERRLQQSLEIEALLSGPDSARIAERLEWRGAHLARRGWPDRAKPDLERALEIAVAAPAADRDRVERILWQLKDLAPVSRVFADLVRARALWRSFLVRMQGRDHPETARASYELSRAYEDAGQPDDAVLLARAACAEDQAASGEARPASALYRDHLDKLLAAAARDRDEGAT